MCRLGTDADGGGDDITVAVKYTTGSPVTIKTYKGGTEELSVTESDLLSGGVALGGDQPQFNDLKIGFDDNGDGDLDDVDDDLVVDESFDSTSKTVSHDKAGNLIDDGTHQYVYDAWHRLIKVRSAADGGAVTLDKAKTQPIV